MSIVADALMSLPLSMLEPRCHSEYLKNWHQKELASNVSPPAVQRAGKNGSGTAVSFDTSQAVP
ncbi:hypothetical protein SDC9_57511 [bioreactor metagenome]|uniref:Uncharacterized protein n=1 Tax=bioreactor metagenome TaxID=1076179 RepID=A0A644X4S7_9ZZZZ